MKSTAAIIVLTACLLAGLCLAAAPSPPLPGAPGAPDAPDAAEPRASASAGTTVTETASIEEIIASDEGGYQARAYIVRWHGNRILLSDPLMQRPLAVGDMVRFSVRRKQIAGQRLLLFVFQGNADCDCTDKAAAATAPAAAPPAAPVFAAGADRRTGLVEEALTVEDAGFHANAYLVRANGARFAVTDPLAQSHYGIGDSISFLVVRASVKDMQRLSAVLMPTPAAADAAGATPAPFAGTAGPAARPPAIAGAPPSREAPVVQAQSGLITEVLSASDAGFRYRAYVVDLEGKRVVVDDPTDASPHQVGEQLSFQSATLTIPTATDHGLLSFSLGSESQDPASEIGAMQVSMRNETATVAEVLSAESGNHWYRAYIVTWKGARVAINDAFATTHYAVGDPISFPVTHASAGTRARLLFMLFDFPRPAKRALSRGPGAATP